MQKEFDSNILKKGLFTKKDILLLAISGGIDSMVLAHLLKNGGYDFSLAHCNFKLRGKDSDADEKFCIEFAKKNDLDISITCFDVKKYCREHKVSVQMAARNLRYNWFEQMRTEKKTDFIITAHQANDVVETVLINLLRGTGIKGLSGIPEKNGHIVRPLLPFTKEQITAFAKKEKIKFRLDKSNLKDDYQRNFLRLNVIPRLKKLNNSLEATFLNNTEIFRQESLIVKEFLDKKKEEVCYMKSGLISINKEKLKKEKHATTILHHLLSPYGFSQTQQQNILKNLLKNGGSGKIFTSGKYKLVIERNELLISENAQYNIDEIKVGSFAEFKKYPLFKITEEAKIQPGKNELVIEKEKLIFPLVIRTKRTGDKFKPFGMNGFKLLSDFFKDEKLTGFEKEKTKILVNGNGEIIWVIGYRSDERYRVKPGNKHLRISVIG